jgi:hypothetical protein
MADPEVALPRSLSLPPDVDTVAGRLRLVIDPELGMNIVDPGVGLWHRGRGWRCPRTDDHQSSAWDGSASAYV